MTRFIHSFAAQQILPPYRTNAISYFWGVLFKIDPAAAQNYIDRFFNATLQPGERVRYEVPEDINFGILLYSRRYDTESFDPSDPDRQTHTETFSADRSWDKLTFTELSVNIPMTEWRTDPARNVSAPTERVWCQPLVVNNNSTMRSSLREIMGKDMLPARFSEALVDSPAPNPDLRGRSLQVTIPGVTTFSPTAKEDWIPFVQLSFPTADYELGGRFSYEACASRISRHCDGATVPDAHCLPQSMRYVSLKQFRDASDPSSTIYRQHVSSVLEFEPGAQSTWLDHNGAQCVFNETDTTREILEFIGVDRSANQLGRNAELLGAFHLTGRVRFGMSIREVSPDQ